MRGRLRAALAPALFTLCLILGFLGAGARAQDLAFPALSGRVVDAASILDPAAIARMSDKLAAFEARTTDQIVVATVASLQDRSIEDYANRLHRHWALGTKERNNGALLLVAPRERKVRIEVGYGLEGALTDALSKTIITTAIAPRFREGQFAAGIEAGVDAILDILGGDAEQWQRRPQIREDGDRGQMLAALFIFFLIIMVIIILQARTSMKGQGRKHRLRDGRWVTLPPTGGGWSSGSSSGSSGGGWSGSSGGGFSGGGGSSGGGGASGDW
jgi:uncharacterized protein